MTMRAYTTLHPSLWEKQTVPKIRPPSQNRMGSLCLSSAVEACPLRSE